jgi:pimeloyl-ACP methyl ester carboxylesterase
VNRVLVRPGAEIVYDITGTGPVVGAAHGMFASRSAEDEVGMVDWSPVVAAGHQLVRYDARAHGRSSGEPVADQYTWPNLANDLLALLDEVSPHAPASFIGASMGTGTLLWAVLKAPERFDRLVLTIPPTAWETRVPQASWYRGEADVIETGGKEDWVAAASQTPLPEIFAGLGDFRLVPDVSEALLPSVLRGAAASDLPDPAALATLTRPTLILAWETDPTHPVSTAQLLANRIPGATLHISSTLSDVRTWGGRTAAFLAVQDVTQ